MSWLIRVQCIKIILQPNIKHTQFVYIFTTNIIQIILSTIRHMLWNTSRAWLYHELPCLLSCQYPISPWKVFRQFVLRNYMNGRVVSMGGAARWIVSIYGIVFSDMVNWFTLSGSLQIVQPFQRIKSTLSWSLVGCLCYANELKWSSVQFGQSGMWQLKRFERWLVRAGHE